MSRTPRTLTPSGRDAGLRRLRNVNRVLIGAAVLATGLLTDVAARAFPGHKRTVQAAALVTAPSAPTAAARTRSGARVPHPSHRRVAHHRLRAPAQPPAAITTQAPAATTAAPAVTTPAPESVAPQPAPAPASSGPVVSSGS